MNPNFLPSSASIENDTMKDSIDARLASLRSERFRSVLSAYTPVSASIRRLCPWIVVIGGLGFGIWLGRSGSESAVKPDSGPKKQINPSRFQHLRELASLILPLFIQTLPQSRSKFTANL